MKRYIKAARLTHRELVNQLSSIREEISQAIKDADSNVIGWSNGYRDNGDGTAKISFGFDLDAVPSAKEAKQLVAGALKFCSRDLQDRVVKLTCGQNSDRGATWFVVNVIVEL